MTCISPTKPRKRHAATPQIIRRLGQNDLNSCQAAVGDCVVVEQGQYTNVRRVSSINCHLDQQPDHHVSAADNCQLAKDELNNAKTNDDIEQAVIKVWTLCED